MFSLHEILIFTKESIGELSVIKCISLAAWQHGQHSQRTARVLKDGKEMRFLLDYIFSVV